MPFCELWGAEHAGLSVFDVLEVSTVVRCVLLFRWVWAWGKVLMLLRFVQQFRQESQSREEDFLGFLGGFVSKSDLRLTVLLASAAGKPVYRVKPSQKQRG